MIDVILIINAGSSSIKFAIYGADKLDMLCRGHIENIGRSAALSVKGSLAEALLSGEAPPEQGRHEDLTGWLLNAIRRRLAEINLIAAGHRVVHGGRLFDQPVRVNSQVMDALANLTPLAPNHQPHNLAAIMAIAGEWPTLPQIACFDTAFHRTQPRLAQLFALPRRLIDEGVLRYGFHGLSYDYIAGRLPEIAGPRAEGRVVVAHLGHGASMCALKQRRSIATTMGLTAMDGLMMGTRCGNLDPGIVLYLIEQKGMTAASVKDLLNNHSGLLGVSGRSHDMRNLLADRDPHAAEAVDLFVYRAVRELGSLIAAAGGLDILVFTAGIGEHAPEIRQRICDAAGFAGGSAGIHLDPLANDRHDLKISTPQSGVDVYVIPTDEEIVIAKATRHLTMQ